MISALVAEVQCRLRSDDFNAQQLSNVLWSLCICQVVASLAKLLKPNPCMLLPCMPCSPAIYLIWWKAKPMNAQNCELHSV